MKRIKWFLIKIFFMLLSTNSLSYAVHGALLKAEVKQEDLSFSSAWARPSVSSSSNSTVYLHIKNNTNNNYTLIAASAMSVANNVELSNSYVDSNGLNQTSNLDKILIPAQTEIELKPGTMSIILFDLKRILRPGDKFYLDLFFENIGKRTVEVEVRD